MNGNEAVAGTSTGGTRRTSARIKSVQVRRKNKEVAATMPVKKKQRVQQKRVSVVTEEEKDDVVVVMEKGDVAMTSECGSGSSEGEKNNNKKKSAFARVKDSIIRKFLYFFWVKTSENINAEEELRRRLEIDDTLAKKLCMAREQIADLEQKISSVSPWYTEFDISEIKDATRNFDPSLKIREGDYGSVFRGFLRHTEVAIKKKHPHSQQGPSEFQQEVQVLSKLRHPNIVTLIGACPDSFIIIYEYLSGGSLEDRLDCKDNTPPFSWKNRIRIAAELCSVLIFLHSCGIVHGDLKPASLLLGKNLVTKLSDFGIYNVLSQHKVSTNNTSMCSRTGPQGTFLYMDPEFLSSGELTSKSDTYSFGFILLRLLTGKPALGLTKEVKCALNENKFKNVLDPTAGDWPFVQAQQLAVLAVACCDMVLKNRPALVSEVWRVLEPMQVFCGLPSFRVRSEGQSQIPHYFVCPIVQETMQDPVVAADGFTYEAEAIKGWSPMTNLQLANTKLVPNHALRFAIQEWLQQP